MADQFVRRSWFILLQTIKGRHFQEDNLNKWFRRLGMIQVGCLETSVTNYSVTRCDIAERGQQLHRCESLKPRKIYACKTHRKCKNNFALCDAQLTSSVPMACGWNHGRSNSPNSYTSLFTGLFKWNTTMAAATQTFRTTPCRHKYFLCGRNKDQKCKKVRNIIKSPSYFHVSLRDSYLSTIPSADYEHTTYNTTDIFTTYIPTTTELSLLRSTRWHFNEPLKTSACGATSGMDVGTSSRQGSVTLLSAT